MLILDCEDSKSLQVLITNKYTRWLVALGFLHYFISLSFRKTFNAEELYFGLEENGMANLVILNAGVKNYISN